MKINRICVQMLTYSVIFYPVIMEILRNNLANIVKKFKKVYNLIMLMFKIQKGSFEILSHLFK